VNLFRHLKVFKYPTCVFQANISVFLGCFVFIFSSSPGPCSPVYETTIYGAISKALHQLRSQTSSKRAGLKCEREMKKNCLLNCNQILGCPGIIISQLGAN
jgi:hypothetical protein